MSKTQVLKSIKTFAKTKTKKKKDSDESDYQDENNLNTSETIEETYQKKTQLEHILLRPDTYIGSTTLDTQEMWIYDDNSNSIQKKSITFSPGLYKIFDEILVNASDNKERDKNMSKIKIDIDIEKNEISIWNDGMGIPITLHKGENMYVPTLIFGHLLTSSNYNDNVKKVTGGRNGFGAKLCNIFSNKFIVETASSKYGKVFKQEWTNNMNCAKDPQIKPFDGNDFTCVKFIPDLKRFGLTCLDNDFVSLVKRRAYDIAGVAHGIKVFFNKEQLKIKDFKSYSLLYLKGINGINGTNDLNGVINDSEKENKIDILYEKVNDRWEICVAPIDSGPQQMSFVNSIATTKGGTHVNYIYDQLISFLMPIISKRVNDKKLIKPIFIKSSLFIFVNSKIENPCFDSQTKENLVLNSKKFGSTCIPSEKFLKQISKACSDMIVEFVNLKSKTALMKISNSSKKIVINGIPKLDDANKAGSTLSSKCVLILTEGDSAKSLAVAGLSVIGRDFYGVFPLRGKLLNVRNATYSTIIKNAEISNLIKILGLNFKCKYNDPSEMKNLRYGKIMIMTDQDEDGSHIKGLIVNFIHSYWPKLIQHGFIQSFITPLIKVFYKNNSHEFFSFPEYQEWRDITPDSHKWRVKYYKGLGTSTSIEAKKYFSSMDRHCINFTYNGDNCDQAIKMAFSKDSVDARKLWLDASLLEAKRRKQLNLPDVYLYQKSTRNISYQDFINMELVQFSNADNQRAIPNLMDGLKTSQRKVLYTMMKRYEKKEIKVAQLAGAVSELTAYHHGEASMASTIIGLAQDFVGSNNINLLLPLGQFGSRLNGGKDAASARYIFTMLNPVTRAIFHPDDDYILTYQMEDNQLVEPEWYCPIIPMVLVNGAEGIGTAYATKIPNHNPREIIEILKLMIKNNGEGLTSIKPWYKGFTGNIIQTGKNKYSILGTLYLLKDNKVEISELPIRTWTQTYKEEILQPMLDVDTNNKKTIELKITSLEEYHSDTKVRFLVTLEKEALKNYTNDYIFKQLKLESLLSATSLVLYDDELVLKKYETIEEIMEKFYKIRLKKYEQRKKYLIDKSTAYAKKLQNQARFILEIISDEISLKNKKKQEMIDMLKNKKYDSDPVKKWQNGIAKSSDNNILSASLMDEDFEKIMEGEIDYEYLYGMSLLHLTNEKKDTLLKERDDLIDQLNMYKKKTIQEMWLNDLDNLLNELDKFENSLLKQQLPGPNVNDMKAGVLKSKAKNINKINITPNRIDKFDYKPALIGEKLKIIKYNKDSKIKNQNLQTDIVKSDTKNDKIKSDKLKSDLKSDLKNDLLEVEIKKTNNKKRSQKEVKEKKTRKRKENFEFIETTSDSSSVDQNIDFEVISEESDIEELFGDQIIVKEEYVNNLKRLNMIRIELPVKKNKNKLIGKKTTITNKKETNKKKSGNKVAKFDDSSDISFDNSNFNMSIYDDEDYM